MKKIGKLRVKLGSQVRIQAELNKFMERNNGRDKMVLKPFEAKGQYLPICNTFFNLVRVDER